MSIDPFLQFADRLAEATLIVSGEGMILAANRGVASRLNLDPGRLRRKRLAEVVTQSPDAVAQYLRLCSRSGDAVPGSLSFVGPGGTELACRVDGVLLRPRDGDADALIMLRLIAREISTQQFVLLNHRIDELNREIGRRKRVEEELLEQRELLRVTLASIGDAVIATDTHGRVIFANAVAEKLTGWTQEEAFGRPLTEVFRIYNEDTQEPIENSAEAVLREGTALAVAEHTMLAARDGTVRAIDDSLAPIRLSSGEVKGVVLVFHDITERRLLEKELRERAEKLAEADRAKDEFLAMLAHELRNPLAPIANALQLLHRESTNGNGNGNELSWAVEIMERQTRHMARLVEDLLDVSRITRRRIELRVERIDLRDVVAHAVEAGRLFITAKHQELDVSVAPEPLVVDADPTRLEQVVGNLLHNASKYTAEGGRIWLSAARDEGSIVLRVRDNGVGIAPEHQPRVFDLFMQADRSLDRSQGGLGIGLTLAHTIIALHGGKITVASAGLGRGTEFVVRLPAAQLRAEEPSRPAAVSVTIPTTPRRILVVDDSPDSAQSLGRLLRRWGHEVTVAHSGPEALALIDSVRPELVLLDIGLPGMDGYAVARTLRQDPRYARLTIAALTGYGQASDRQRSFEAGFDHHLVKPVDPGVLQDVLGSMAETSGEDG